MRSINKSFRVLGSGPFILEYNGLVRTVVADIKIENYGYENYKFDPSFYYKICGYPEVRVGGKLYIMLENGRCVRIKNPIVSLEGHESSVSTIFDFTDDMLQPIDRWWNDGEDLVFTLRSSLFDDPMFSSICAALPAIPDFTDDPIFGRLSNGTWFLFDPRLSLDTNTPSSPISDGGKSTFTVSGGKKHCSNAPRTFLNEDDCKLSSNACAQSSNNHVSILLNNSTITSLNNLTGRYVYGIKGLLVKHEGMVLGHPCTPGLRSRWEPRNIVDCKITSLHEETNSTLFGLLSKRTDTNVYIRDIYFPDQGSYCHEQDTEPEIEIEVNGQCWKRVHSEHMSIFDVSHFGLVINVIK